MRNACHPKVLEVRKRIELQGDDALTKTMPSRQGIVEIAARRPLLRHHTWRFAAPRKTR